jgi:hypothetical protein
VPSLGIDVLIAGIIAVGVICGLSWSLRGIAIVEVVTYSEVGFGLLSSLSTGSRLER